MCRVSCSPAALLAVVVSVALASTFAAPAAQPGLRQRRSAAPDVNGLETWKSIGNSSLCPAVVVFNPSLRVHEVWCPDGVEGEEVDARGAKYVCTTLRYSLPVADSDVDIAGGCVALVSHVAEVDANQPHRD